MPRNRSVLRATQARPFALFYGESPRKQVNGGNYHLRSKCSTLTGALRAAVVRLHVRGDAARVDIYDILDNHLGFVCMTPTGMKIDFTHWAMTQHAKEQQAPEGVQFY